MRKIKFVVVHCTSTFPYTKKQSFLRNWHYVVKRNGQCQQLCNEDERTENAVEQGQVPEAIHIAWEGGVDHCGNPVNNIHASQEEKLFYKLIELTEKYPDAEIIGADLWSGNMNSPGFDLKEWLAGFIPNL